MGTVELVQDPLKLAPYIKTSKGVDQLEEKQILQLLNTGQLIIPNEYKMHCTTPKMLNLLNRFDKIGISYNITLEAAVKVIKQNENKIFTTAIEIKNAETKEEMIDVINKLHYVIYDLDFPVMEFRRYFSDIGEEFTQIYRDLNEYIATNNIEYLYFEFKSEKDKLLFCQEILQHFK